MCGIAGAWTYNIEESIKLARLMGGYLTHRGPDRSGEWHDSSSGVSFSHRRLTIVDASDCGDQPAVSLSGRWIISFNGEIYNYEQLRMELKRSGVHPRGRSDTQVLLEAIDLWGIEGALAKSYGMFAFSAWDLREKKLYLARDRIGEKPLYYGIVNSRLVFASELKAFKGAGLSLEISRDVLALFLRFNYVPEPHSIFEGILKLPPGCIAQFSKSALELSSIPSSLNEIQVSDQYNLKRYWSLQATAMAGMERPFQGSFDEACEETDRLMNKIVGEQMLADVPVGAFLSGGIDSSLIVSIMQKINFRPVKTFTIGYSENSYNETPMASKIARYLGCEHEEVHFGPADALTLIPSLPIIYDEPFADVTQLPAILLSKFAKSKVTVALSGDGGDELFAGYPRYQFCTGLWSLLCKLPQNLRSLASQFGIWLGPARWHVLGRLLYILTSKKQFHRFAHRADRLSLLLISNSFEQLYLNLCSQWINPNSILINGEESTCFLNSEKDWGKFNDPIRKLMFADNMSYLPGDILTTTDRASMATSLETRSPFIDARIIEFAWTLPTDYLIRAKLGKAILRDLLKKYLPRSLYDRPKTGFSVPIGEWIRADLREWAEDMLSEKKLIDGGYLKSESIRKAWRQHLKGERDFAQPLWGVLMWQAWLERWGSASKNLSHDSIYNIVPSVPSPALKTVNN